MYIDKYIYIYIYRCVSLFHLFIRGRCNELCFEGSIVIHLKRPFPLIRTFHQSRLLVPRRRCPVRHPRASWYLALLAMASRTGMRDTTGQHFRQRLAGRAKPPPGFARILMVAAGSVGTRTSPLQLGSKLLQSLRKEKLLAPMVASPQGRHHQHNTYIQTWTTDHRQRTRRRTR